MEGERLLREGWSVLLREGWEGRIGCVRKGWEGRRVVVRGKWKEKGFRNEEQRMCY